MVVAPAPGDFIQGDWTAEIGVAMSAWTDYSSSFQITADTVNPTKGNSTYSARFCKIGRLCYCAFRINIGSTFTPGTGTYYFPFPVPAVGSALGAGSAMIFDSGTAFRTGVIIPVNANNAQITRDNAGGALGSDGPGTAWAAGDYIKASLTYEAA